MTNESNAITVIIGVFISVASFFGGIFAAKKKEGRDQGETSSDLSFLKKEVSEIKRLLEREQDTHRQEVKDLRDEIKALSERLDERLDKHVLMHHNRPEG